MEAKADKLFHDAIDKLHQAQEECYRPEEDVVTYMICKNAQSSIENFLKGYLVQNEIDPGDYRTLNALIGKCITINKNFRKVDLSAFDCKSGSLDSRFCNDGLKVCDCLNASGRLEEFLRQEKVIV